MSFSIAAMRRSHPLILESVPEVAPKSILNFSPKGLIDIVSSSSALIRDSETGQGIQRQLVLRKITLSFASFIAHSLELTTVKRLPSFSTTSFLFRQTSLFQKSSGGPFLNQSVSGYASNPDIGQRSWVNQNIGQLIFRSSLIPIVFN